MKSEIMSLNQIKKIGIDVLANTLGPIDMIRFLQQFDMGKGDYTKERKLWLNNINIEDIMKGIEEEKQDI